MQERRAYKYMHKKVHLNILAQCAFGHSKLPYLRSFTVQLHICTLMTAGNPSWGCVQMSNLICPLLTLTLAGHSCLFDTYTHLNEPKNTQMTSNMILLCILWNVVKDTSRWNLFYVFTRFYAFPKEVSSTEVSIFPKYIIIWTTM